MPPRFDTVHKHLAACCWAAAIVTAVAAPAYSTEKVIHAFAGGADGVFPFGWIISDKAENLYGTTLEGGGGGDCRESLGCGTIYEVTADGTESVLHAFSGGCDGAFPHSGLVADKSGDMYGTTGAGGTCNSDDGSGTVYRLGADGTETVIYAFKGGNDGLDPQGNVILGTKGRLLGTTEFGGNMAICGGNGCGTVFEVRPNGKESVLYTFQSGNDGAEPTSGVIMDEAGNLYGTTSRGGGTGCDGDGCGTVYKLAPDGTETIFHAFQGGNDGENPESGLTADTAGSLYGTTTDGGSGVGAGTVFKITPDGTESLLVSFQGGTDGGDPVAGVVLDKAGNLFGTTYFGGTGCGRSGCGIVFELAPDGTETVLNAFDKRHFGRNPSAGVLLGKKGVVYGTTLEGGKGNNGVVFELKK